MRSYSALVTATLGLFLAAGSTPAFAKAKGKRPAPPAECKSDKDCTLAQDGCCGCNAGGKQRAIPAAAKAAYEKKSKKACKDTGCPALMSEDESCVKSAVCKEGTCKLGG